MTSPQRVVVRALATLAALGFALAPSAALAADGSIAHVESEPGSVQLLVSVPADADVDLDGVTVTVDGKAASATAETAGAEDTVRRTSVLVVDTSKSMEGERFAAAQAAAPTPTIAAMGRPTRMAAEAPAPASRMPDGDVMARATGGVRNRSRNDRRLTRMIAAGTWVAASP